MLRCSFFGDIAKVHKVFYLAIRAAEKIKDYNKVMESFYALAIYYTQVKDTQRLDNILADIREVFRKAGGNVPPRAYYSWYSVATARYALDTDCPDMRDSALLYSRKSLDIVENMVRNWNEVLPILRGTIIIMHCFSSISLM